MKRDTHRNKFSVSTKYYHADDEVNCKLWRKEADSLKKLLNRVKSFINHEGKLIIRGDSLTSIKQALAGLLRRIPTDKEMKPTAEIVSGLISTLP